MRLATEVSQAAHVEQFARRTVRFAGIERDAGGEVDHRHHRLGEFAIGDLLANAELVDAVDDVLRHKENTGVRQVVDTDVVSFCGVSCTRPNSSEVLAW